ncbi:hypothetical protein WJX82_001351 [Trebouxia sp. C0006]
MYYEVTKLWEQRQLVAGTTAVGEPPERPGRDDSKVRVVAPGKMPALGKGGSLASRQAILHSLVHIESWAVDLSWDAVARFGSDPQYALPEAFLDDFVQVANDEASHFQQLQQRLEAIGSSYGALPVHDGLWESAAATAHSLPARLAIESCVHEARGLDRLPHTIQRFRNSGDGESAKLLEKIYQEEIAHCAAGVRWLTYLHTQALTANHSQEHNIKQQLQNADAVKYATVEEWFHSLVRAHFKGSLKPPFNEEARAAAGFGPEWYLPLSSVILQ